MVKWIVLVVVAAAAFVVFGGGLRPPASDPVIGDMAAPADASLNAETEELDQKPGQVTIGRGEEEGEGLGTTLANAGPPTGGPV